MPTEAAGTPHPEAFGSFRVLHQIGAGTLGPVFRAYDPEQDRLVAVKLFRLDLPPDRVHRLVSELQQLVDRDITHPAIASPLAADIVGVEAYLAQDFVAGESVDAVVRAHGPAPPAEAARVAMQLAGALDFAADGHVEHGALHPRDVLVSPDDARVTGFGIARALERIGVGMPVRRPFTAPERAAAAAWDRRADIFSLAALAHELLWGRRIAAIGEEAADALTEIAGTDLAALRVVFARALAENPADRYETATAFAQALKNALPVGPTLSPPEVEPRLLVGPTLRSGVSRESEPWLPLEEDPALVNDDFDAANVFAPEAVPAPVESVERSIAFERKRPDAPALEFDRAAEEMEATLNDSSPIAIPPSDVPFERSRSALWPLTLALGIGIAVGFALGYGVATRPSAALDARAEAATPAAAARSGAVARGVTETEVRLTPHPEAAPAPPVAVLAPPAGRSGSVREEPPPSAGAKTADASAPAVRPSTAASPPPAALAGRILIRTTPAGATAFLDGKDVGPTPVTLRDVDRGAHTVRVARDGYATEDRRVSMTPARPAQSVTIELTRARRAVPAPLTPAALSRPSAPINVESRPAGASVLLDGTLVGKTPLTLNDVASGEHAISIDLGGYRRWSGSVRVVAGERARVTASLER